jgi:SAM-dependent methyltransferase
MVRTPKQQGICYQRSGMRRRRPQRRASEAKWGAAANSAILMTARGGIQILCRRFGLLERNSLQDRNRRVVQSKEPRQKSFRVWNPIGASPSRRFRAASQTSENYMELTKGDSVNSKKALWDRKYEQGLPSLTEPDPFFLSAYEKFAVHSFPSCGAALDIAAGLGRHSLWLAARNWRVSAVDVSKVAIDSLRNASGLLNIPLNLFELDAAEYTFQPASFDLVLLFYHLDRDLFPKIISALRPGGLLICKMAIDWNGEPRSPEESPGPLAKMELGSLVSDMRVLSYHERPVGRRGVAEFVGRK